MSDDDKTRDPSDQESHPFTREVILKRVSEISRDERSSICLHLMVKNGESVVGRLIDNVGPYIDYVVAVLNDCEDGTEGILAERCRANSLLLHLEHVTRENHPEWYILDEPATYKIGRPLSGEEFGGPFTGAPILANWAAARNVGWQICPGKWRLFLDADDVVEDPECLPGLVKALEAEGVELACSSYAFHVDAEGRALGSSFRERLALNIPRIRWGKPIHECLAGTTRIAHVRGNLRVRDMRDNRGKDVRVPGRNFKILYHRARTRDWEVSPRLYADMIQEVRHMATAPGMMELAEALLDKYLEEATWPEERGWAYAMVAEMREGLGGIDKAIAGYEDSLECHPGMKTAFRLCRARFKRACSLKDKVEEAEGMGHVVPEMRSMLENSWRSVIEAYELGVENKNVHQALDDGPLYEEMEAIHAAGACLELGAPSRALELTEKALAAFPECSALNVMDGEIRKHLLEIATK
jgi:hypothetical protein